MTTRVLFLGAMLLSGATAHAELFPVELETGIRHTSAGDEVAYTLFVPKPTPGLPNPPWPAVILNHGFARSKQTQSKNAAYLAKRGFVVLTPNLVGLGGIAARTANVEMTLDHLKWLAARSTTPGDLLDGLVDVRRLGLAGHSAGGALSFESAIESQASDVPVAALFLLDAVPWQSTLDAAPGMPLIAIGSLRSEPSSCNADGRVRDLLGSLEFAVEDVRIVGGTHCDPENPTDLLCRWVCGGSSGLGRFLYLRLMTLFFQEALNAPPIESVHIGYGRALDWLEDRGSVVRETALETGLIEPTEPR